MSDDSKIDAVLSEEEKTRIARALNSRQANKPCPRCGWREFHLLDGYVSHTVQTSQQHLRIGPPAIPCAVTFCGNCGFISQHALGVLGLLDDPSEPGGE